MKESYKVLFGILVMCGLLILVDYVVGTTMKKMYLACQSGNIGRQIYCMREMDEDILILGSSRAAHHYVPSIIEDSLHMSCFNAGCEGECIYYYYAILSAYLHRGQKPKLVVIDVIDLDLEKSMDASFSLDAACSALAPHYGEVPSIDSLFALKGRKYEFCLYSKSYRYNSKLVQLIKCHKVSSIKNNGYEPLGARPAYRMDNMSDVYNDTNQSFEKDSLKEIYLKKILTLCKNSKIPVCVTCSPIFHSHNITSAMKAIRAIVESNGIPFFDFSTHPDCQDKILYYDRTHLNNDGAHRYSSIIAHQIKKLCCLYECDIDGSNQ